ncbi:sucrose-phosphatase 2 isoform X2 [Rosa chinensis]|uniref:sucrose-phosphatase 2 isoform X2 n=1 Tax=Rosa chinensis TaxID=74649 RepID=UPI000D089AD7|nr:sucrose-phosphatase 2 isoform X2 [Rosa chinensis]
MDSRLNGSARLMLVSDLDYTMVDHDDRGNTSLLRFNALWEAYYRHDSLLVFSTGRSPLSYKPLRNEKPLLTPDITIMSVGTEIIYGEGDAMLPDDGWQHYLNHNWDRNIVVEETTKFPQLTPQAEAEQRPHKVSFYVDKVEATEIMNVLAERLAKRGVGNAQEELLHWYAHNAKSNRRILHATERCAAGILQGIGNFHLGPNVSPRDIKDFQKCKVNIFSPAYEVVKFYLFYEKWRRAEVEKSEQYMQNLRSIFHSLGVFVHPSGMELPFHQCIDAMARLYGDRQGNQFWTWVDQLTSAQIGSDTWLVKFYKWELNENERQCTLTTVLIKSQVEVPDTFTWLHMHQTWLDGFAIANAERWLF